jgi:hypothetical protein
VRAALALLLVAAVAGSAPDRTIVAGASREAARIGPYRYGLAPGYAAAVRAFGAPATLAGAGAGLCAAYWPRLGLTIRFGPAAGDACGSSAIEAATWQGATVTATAWRTAAGLRVGDSLTRLRRLYPRARPGGAGWNLVYRRGEVGVTVYLRADVRRGRVVAIVLPPGNVSVARA